MRCQSWTAHLQLREAGIADEPSLQALDGVAQRGDFERIGFIHEAVTGRRCVVAVDGGRLVGYVVTNARPFFAHDFVELLMVEDQFRRRGVGRVLLRAAVDSAGTHRVVSSTNGSNRAMRRLFLAGGWASSGRLTGLDAGDPEVVYFIDR